jgi:Mlc titration factor MtfA (ptsG expression regulator)
VPAGIIIHPDPWTTVFGFLKRRRRERIRGQPFPPEWRAIIQRNVPMFARLPEDDRQELLRRVLVFLAEKNFEGVGGLQALRAAARTGRKSLLDHYGATNEAEFFAVASECFFERPVQLRTRHAELYEELARYYGQDPAGAIGAGSVRGG